MAENIIGEDLEQNGASNQHRDGLITVVLTADNHLGYAAFAQHPRKREERRQRLRQAFQEAVAFAIGQGVDFFIQAGDLFDTANPTEQDRSFVAARLAQLKKKGVRTFALGGVHDTPTETHSSLDEVTPAPQLSYERLDADALHYFAPLPSNAISATWSLGETSTLDIRSLPLQSSFELEPVIVDIRGIRVGICGLGVLADYEGDPLAHVRVQDDIERATISLLILHAPIEGLATGSSLLETRAQVSRSTISNQSTFRHILAGYHHGYRRLRIGQCDVIVAGATQHLDFNHPDDEPGFVFLGLAADGVRWCNHITVDALPLRRLVVRASELGTDATAQVIEHLRPLCDPHTLVQLRLEGPLTRRQYHQLDLNQIRRYGDEHCFDLSIDDSALSFLPEQEAIAVETGERFSLREELLVLADEWIAAAQDEQEKKAIQATKEELLATLDVGKVGTRFIASDRSRAS